MAWFILLLCAIILILFGVKCYIYGNDNFWPDRGVPMVKGSEVVPWYDQLFFRIPFHEIEIEIYKKFKKMGNLKFGFGGVMEIRRPFAFLTDLDLINLIFVKDFEHFTNRRVFGKNDGLFEKMLCSMDDPPWRETRAALAPLFTPNKIQRIFELINEAGNKMVDFLICEIGSSKEIEMQEICGNYTTDLIASTVFGQENTHFHDTTSQFAKMTLKFRNQFAGIYMLKLCMAIMMPGLFSWLGMRFLDEKSSAFFKDVIKLSIIKKTLRDRARSGEKRNDFIQLLMESQTNLSDDVLMAQCIQFIWAGFDSTETLLMYAAYELAINLEIQEKLAAEIENAFEKNKKFSYDELNQLEYLDMVVSETLRKYPPQTRAERECTKTFKIPGTAMEFEKGLAVAVPIWSIHHDPDIYPDPEKFIPERFNKDNNHRRHSSAFMPFGLGPRRCLGMDFALIAGKSFLAHLVRNFEIQPTSRTTIPMKFLAGESLIPLGGIWLKVSIRK